MRARRQSQKRRLVYGALKLGGYACIGLFAMTVMVPVGMTSKVIKGVHRGYRAHMAPLDHHDMIEALQSEAPEPSPPSHPITKKKKKQSPPPSAQAQSPLFRLPAEVREIIWEYAVGHRFVHQPQPKDSSRKNPARSPIVSKHTRVLSPGRSGYPWTWPQQAHIRAPWVWNVDPNGGIHPSELARPRHQLKWDTNTETFRRHIYDPRAPCWYHEGDHWTGLDLLLTCRQVAKEAQPLMFRDNTFSFLFLEHLRVFRAQIGSPTFSTLRYLHLDLLVGPGKRLGVVNRHAWEELWRLVDVEMRSLRELDLEMHVPSEAKLGTWLGYENLDGIIATHFRESLPDWVDSLAPLQGRLRRARLMANGNHQHVAMTGPTPDVPQLITKVQDRLKEMQNAITMDGKGGWLELDPWAKHFEFRNKAAVELEVNESPSSANGSPTAPAIADGTDAEASTGLSEVIWKRWMTTSPLSLENLVFWNSAPLCY